MEEPQTEATSRHLSLTDNAREHEAIGSAIEFVERRHICDSRHDCYDPESNEHCLGCVAFDTVNIHEAEAVGNTILHSMSGVQIESSDFMRKVCVRQMPTTPRIRTPVGGGSDTPANLFNTELCLLRIMMSKQPIPDVFSFELSECPTALFSQGMMRRSGKARFGKSSVGQ